MKIVVSMLILINLMVVWCILNVLLFCNIVQLTGNAKSSWATSHLGNKWASLARPFRYVSLSCIWLRVISFLSSWRYHFKKLLSSWLIFLLKQYVSGWERCHRNWLGYHKLMCVSYGGQGEFNFSFRYSAPLFGKIGWHCKNLINFFHFL